MIQPGLKLPHLLERCRMDWQGLADFRERRRRSRDYYRGIPREDVLDPDRKVLVSEDEWIRSQGLTPIRINDIAAAVRALKGQFIANRVSQSVYPIDREDNEAAEMMSNALRVVLNINRAAEIDTMMFEEAVVSGLFGYYSRYVKTHPKVHRPEIRIDPIDPSKLFFNRIRDPRCFDLTRIGQMHDLDVDELVSIFAVTPHDEEYLRDLYRHVSNTIAEQFVTGFQLADMQDFYTSGDISKCRVIELWQKEYAWRVYLYDESTGDIQPQDIAIDEVGVLNAQRLVEALAEGNTPPGFVYLERQYLPVWRYYFLTPYGDVLAKGTSPFWHQEHPFTIGFATIFDGEIWGWVEDQINPQRVANRLATMIDAMILSSAKGAWIIHEDAIPSQYTNRLDEYVNILSSTNGVIVWKGKPGVTPVPQQIQTASIPAGVWQWLMTMKQAIRSSGLPEANLGETPPSGTPASLYQTMVMQGNQKAGAIFDSFYAVRRERDIKICQLAAQFYKTQRFIPTEVRRVDGTKGVLYDPERVRELEFDVVIADTQDSPAERLKHEEFLQNLLNTNRLTLRQYLTMSALPRAEVLLHLIERTNPLLADQTIGAEELAQLQASLQQAAQAGDQDAIATLTQAS